MEQKTEIVRQFAACSRDYRKADKIEHSMWELSGQRAYRIAMGCEDLNDHEQLRQDPMLAVLGGKKDAEGGNGGGTRIGAWRKRVRAY